MAVGGLLLKGTSVFIRALQFLASLAVLGIFAYYLVYLRRHDFPTYTWVRAVTGIAGASALYTIIALLLVCCLGGKIVFAFIGIALDVAFIGAWIAVVYYTRHGGTNSCSSYSQSRSSFEGYTTIVDNNNTDPLDRLDQARLLCRLQKASFGIAIAAIVLFLLSAIFSLFMGKHHQREKRKAPNTPVVAGAPRKQRFWQRKQKHNSALPDPEHGAYRPSHDTAMTGATATDGTQYGHANTAYGTQPKYGNGVNY